MPSAGPGGGRRRRNRPPKRSSSVWGCERTAWTEAWREEERTTAMTRRRRRRRRPPNAPPRPLPAPPRPFPCFSKIVFQKGWGLLYRNCSMLYPIGKRQWHNLFLCCQSISMYGISMKEKVRSDPKLYFHSIPLLLRRSCSATLTKQIRKQNVCRIM